MAVSCGAVLALFALAGVCQAFFIHPATSNRARDLSNQRHVSDNQLERRGNGIGDSSRLSFKECNLSSGERLDCGFYGVTEYKCYERGCCWGQTEEEDVPWCFHSKPTLKPFCNVNNDERNECGYYNIRKAECLGKGCCWRPSSEGGAPWCFHYHVKPMTSDSCGVPAKSPQVMSRIVGGVEVRPNTWPWQVSIQVNEDHFCGGSLIAPQWVVTAAHCAPGLQWGDPSVVAGMHSLTASDEPKVRAAVSQVIPHERFDTNGNNDHDIMLLKLAEPISFNEVMSPVCLPDQGESFSSGKHCYTTGWGTLQSGGSSPDVLQQVMVPLLNTSVCNQPSWYDGKIDETMVCAGYEEGGKDSCQGDSGGPLVCFQKERWALVGITSWGHGCAYESKPGIYANVTSMTNWVHMKMTEYS